MTGELESRAFVKCKNNMHSDEERSAAGNQGLRVGKIEFLDVCQSRPCGHGAEYAQLGQLSVK